MQWKRGNPQAQAPPHRMYYALAGLDKYSLSSPLAGGPWAVLRFVQGAGPAKVIGHAPTLAAAKAIAAAKAARVARRGGRPYAARVAAQAAEEARLERFYAAR